MDILVTALDDDTRDTLDADNGDGLGLRVYSGPLEPVEGCNDPHGFLNCSPLVKDLLLGGFVRLGAFAELLSTMPPVIVITITITKILLIESTLAGGYHVYGVIGTHTHTHTHTHAPTGAARDGGHGEFRKWGF